MITVSIVTYKTNLGELSKCLQSLISSLVSQIYIVDNSNERYIADFCQQYPNVIYIGSENVGYGAGHNQALRQVLNSGGKYQLILNWMYILNLRFWNFWQHIWMHMRM